MAFQARVRAWLAKLAEIANSLKDGRLSAASRTKLQAEMKAVKAKKPSHFEHLEVAAAYHIIKGYNSIRPEALHLNDVKQWRRALEAGPLTNAKRGGKPKGKRPAPASNAASASAASADPPKRIRGTMFSRQADGDVAWPPRISARRQAPPWLARDGHEEYPLRLPTLQRGREDVHACSIKLGGCQHAAPRRHATAATAQPCSRIGYERRLVSCQDALSRSIRHVQHVLDSVHAWQRGKDVLQGLL